MMAIHGYIELRCGACKNRNICIKYEKIQMNEVIDYKTLMAMANCPVWDPEKKEKEGDR